MAEERRFIAYGEPAPSGRSAGGASNRFRMSSVYGSSRRCSSRRSRSRISCLLRLHRFQQDRLGGVFSPSRPGDEHG